MMYLVYDKALIARSSGDIVFFKIEEVEDPAAGRNKKDAPKLRLWKQYQEIEVRGLIYYIKGNVRIQITTDDKIYFYKIDKETFRAEMDNVMYNYMGCNQMMFGSRVRYGVTYKTN